MSTTHSKAYLKHGYVDQLLLIQINHMALLPVLYLRTYTISMGETFYSFQDNSFSVTYVIQMDVTYRSDACYFFNQRKSEEGLHV